MNGLRVVLRCERPSASEGAALHRPAWPGNAMNGVGVIGTGFMGVAHTEALRRLGLDVVGIVGSSPARARAKATVAPLPPVYDSVDALLADPAVGTVHVTSPNNLHAEHARAVIAAGKHVVCEKPLGVSSAETSELLARADAAGVVHAVCFNLRHYPQNQNAAALVAAGAGRRAAVRHRPVPPGLAAAGDGLELATRRRPSGHAARRRRHRVALARPDPLHHRARRRRGPRRPAHVRAGAQPSGRRRRVVRRRHRCRRRRARPRGRWRATTPPGCCCGTRTGCAARARSARCRRGAEHRRVGARPVRRARWPGRRRTPSGCGSATGAVPTRSSRRTPRS